MRRLLGIVLLIAASVAPAALYAQDGVQMSITVPSAAEAAASVTTSNVLIAKTRELLLNGFPARLHYRLELWRKGSFFGLFDDLENASEWDVYVIYDPVQRSYRVVRQHGRQQEDFGGFGSLTSAEAAMDKDYRVALDPQRRGASYYYLLSLDVQTLTETDLDALQRWLRGDFEPAVHGKNSPVSAIQNGLGTLLSRMLGGEKRHYEKRSETFRG